MTEYKGSKAQILSRLEAGEAYLQARDELGRFLIKKSGMVASIDRAISDVANPFAASPLAFVAREAGIKVRELDGDIRGADFLRSVSIVSRVKRRIMGEAY